MNKLIILVALAMGAPALAAQKAPAPKAKAEKAAPPKEAPPPSDPDMESAGKVIEIDPSGGAKVLKGEAEVATPSEKLALKAGEVGAADACRTRFKAQCSLLKRCLKTDELDCDALAAGCAQLSGKAAFSKKLLDDCVAGVNALSCDPPGDGLDANPENRVAACKAVLLAEQQGSPPAELPSDSKRPGKDGEPDLSKFKTIEVPQDLELPLGEQ
jgi:hypothetical protein